MRVAGIFMTLLQRGIAAGWLILAVLLLRLFLRQAPKWVRCVLWEIVAIRLISPIFGESPLSLMPRAGSVVPAVVPQAQPVPAQESTVSELGGAVGSAAAMGPGQDWALAAGIIWLAGLVLLLGCALVSWLRLRHRLREAVLWRDNLWLCDAVSAPFIFGVFRPRIYLPSGGVGAEIDYVIAHERAHLKRGDHWWKPLGYVLLSVYWFHPLVWVGYLLFCRDVELACDERVIRELDLEGRKAYSSALVSYGMQRKLVMVCPLAFGEVGVKERVKAVLNYRKPAFWLVLAALVACAAVIVCFLTDPKPEREAELSETMGPVAAIPEEEDLQTLMKEYAAFGVTEENGVLYYEGEQIRYFLDGYEDGEGVYSRYKYYDEMGTVDIHTVRTDTVNDDGSVTLFGPITDIIPYPQEGIDDREFWDGDTAVIAQAEVLEVEEREEQWEELLRPYSAFGVTYEYDPGTDDFKLYYDGAEVRGLYDEVKGVWITEHTGNRAYSEDAIELYAVYDGRELVGLRKATLEEQAEWTALRQEAQAEGTGETGGEGGLTIAQRLEPCREYGLTYEEISGNKGDLYYNGTLLEGFRDDQPDGSIFTTQSATAGGTGTAYTVYNEDGELTGISVW